MLRDVWACALWVAQPTSGFCVSVVRSDWSGSPNWQQFKQDNGLSNRGLF
jgi:hypothetical protein